MGKKRARKIRKRTRGLGPKIAPVYQGGITPAVAFDAPVWGVSNAEAKALRSWAVAALPPHNKQASVSLKLSVMGDKSAIYCLAPILQWQRMLWLTCGGAQEAQLGGATFRGMREWWSASIGWQMQPFVGAMPRACQRRRPHCQEN